MTKYVLIISIALIFLTMLSCTHNNGGEASLYGNWKLQRISHEGVDDATYSGNVFWKFQNKTIEMMQVIDEHETAATFGNFRLADQTLFLSFPDEQFAPLLGLPRESELQVVRLKGSQMILSFGDPATLYYFKKW